MKCHKQKTTKQSPGQNNGYVIPHSYKIPKLHSYGKTGSGLLTLKVLWNMSVYPFRSPSKLGGRNMPVCHSIYAEARGQAGRTESLPLLHSSPGTKFAPFSLVAGTPPPHFLCHLTVPHRLRALKRFTTFPQPYLPHPTGQ